MRTYMFVLDTHGHTMRWLVIRALQIPAIVCHNDKGAFSPTDNVHQYNAIVGARLVCVRSLPPRSDFVATLHNTF